MLGKTVCVRGGRYSGVVGIVVAEDKSSAAVETDDERGWYGRVHMSKKNLVQVAPGFKI
jgi:transcription elongation factor